MSAWEIFCASWRAVMWWNCYLLCNYFDNPIAKNPIMPNKQLLDIADKKSPLANPFATFDHREFLCGWGSAFVNITATYPLYKTIFRQVWRISFVFEARTKYSIYLLRCYMAFKLEQHSISLGMKDFSTFTEGCFHLWHRKLFRYRWCSGFTMVSRWLSCSRH